MSIKARAIAYEAGALLFPCLLAILLLAPLLSGHTPGGHDALLSLPPWQEAWHAGIDDVSPDLEVLRYTPWRIFAADSIRRGDSLLWNPLEGCGQPFFAAWETRCLSPFSIPFYLLPTGIALGLSAWLKLAVAGLCAYIAARCFGLTRLPSLLVAVGFESSAMMQGCLGIPASDALPWLPLLVLAAERYSVGRVRLWPLDALVFALMLLGGGPGPSFAAFLLCGLFITFRMLFALYRPRDVLRAVAAFTGAYLAGAALSAVQILPWLEFIRNARDTLPVQMGWSVHNWLAFVAPLYMGPSASANPGVVMEGAGQAVSMLYLGAIPAVLLPVWLSLRRHAHFDTRHRIESLMLASISLTILSAAAPWLGRLPFIPPNMAGILTLGNALTASLFAAESMVLWEKLNPNALPGVLRRLVPMMIIMAVVITICLVFAAWESQPDAPGGLQQSARFCFFAALALMTLGGVLLYPRPIVFTAILCALIMLDQYGASRGLVPFSHKSSVFPETGAIRALKASSFRLSGSDSLVHWPFQGNLAPQVYAASGLALKRNLSFLERASEEPLLLRRTGARNLLLTASDIRGGFARVRPLLRLQSVLAFGGASFIDMKAQGRAFMAFHAIDVDHFDPAMLIPGGPALTEGDVPPPVEQGPEGEASVVEESNARVVVEVTATRPGILVLADSFYPGWRAIVDEKEQEVYPVDGFMRGVTLDAGPHRIVYIHHSTALIYGALTSSITAAILAIVLGFNLWPRKKKWGPESVADLPRYSPV